MSREFMEAMMNAAKACPALSGRDDDAPPATPEELAELGARYLVKHDFKPGDLVAWKPGLRDCKWPKEGSAGVVMEVILEHRREESDGGNHYYEPIDVRVGVVVNETFEGFWIDGNRLEPYRAPEHAPEDMPMPDAEATAFAEAAAL